EWGGNSPFRKRASRSECPTSACRCCCSVGRMRRVLGVWRRASREVNAPRSRWRRHPFRRHHMLAVGMERTEILLPARGRFDLRATVLSRSHDELAPFRRQDGARPLPQRAQELPGGAVYHPAVRPGGGRVVLRVTGEDASEIEALAPLAARVRRSLALDLDLAPFHRLCRGDPLLRPAVSLGMGRLLRGTSLFEDLVRSL